jgi:colanic acid biosynthesis glycosyl transferase WcaI
MDQQPLKLLVITMMYQPDCVGIAAIASDMCASLAQRGHDVTVYTTFPYYPQWKLKAKVSWRIQEETIEGVQVRRHRIFVPSNPSRLLPRLIHELSFPVSLLRSIFHGKKYDVVMVYCPLMGGVVFAALRKLLFRDPLWVNIQDIPVEAAAASGIIRSGLLARLASFVQKFVLNRGDVWSSISPEMVQQLESIKSAKVPIHLCPNWLTHSLHEQIRQLPDKVGRIPRQPPKLLYCGTIGKKQGLLEFCQMLSTCKSDYHFQIQGGGSEAAAVRRWVESSGDRRFEFDTLLSQSEFAQAIHAADWFVIPQKSSIGCSFFPSKLIPSMFIGTPILAITENTGPLGREVEENGLGLIVPWSQVNRLTNELDAFRFAPEKFEKLQANCVRRAQSYDRDFAIDKFESLLQDLRAAQSASSLIPSRSNDRVPSV